MTFAIFTERLVEFLSFKYDFAAMAFASSVLVGAVCGVVGVFLVLRRMALVGDATAHATLPGVCLGFAIAQAKSVFWLVSGAAASAMVAGWLISRFSIGARTRPDAAIGIVLASFFGAGIVALSYVQNSPTGAQSGLTSFLFGNAAAVDMQQLISLFVVTVVVLGAIVFAFRPLSLAAFDETYARTLGLPVDLIRTSILVALAAAVVVSIQAVGVVLVSAMLIIPANAALYLTKRFEMTVVLSGLIGAASGVIGAVTSYIFEGVATGPAMVLAAVFIFVVCVLLGSRGVLRQRRPEFA